MYVYVVTPSFGGSMRRIARHRVSGCTRRCNNHPLTSLLAYIALVEPSWYHKLREGRGRICGQQFHFLAEGGTCVSPLAVRVSTKLWIYIPVATSKGMPSGLVMPRVRHSFHSLRSCFGFWLRLDFELRVAAQLYGQCSCNCSGGILGFLLRALHRDYFDRWDEDFNGGGILFLFLDWLNFFRAIVFFGMIYRRHG